MLPYWSIAMRYCYELLARYPRKKPWTRSGLVSTESQTNSANVLLYGSPIRAKFFGASIGSASKQTPPQLSKVSSAVSYKLLLALPAYS